MDANTFRGVVIGAVCGIALTVGVVFNMNVNTKVNNLTAAHNNLVQVLSQPQQVPPREMMPSEGKK